MHSSQTFRAMVDSLDADPDRLPTTLVPARIEGEALPEFVPRAEELDRVRRMVTEAAPTDRFQPLVLLNPNCSDLIPLRAWPRDRYVDLARRLLQARPDLRIALTGAPDETEAASALVAEVDGPRYQSNAACGGDGYNGASMSRCDGVTVYISVSQSSRIMTLFCF